MNGKLLLETGNPQHVADGRRRIDQVDVGTVASRLFPQQQQHAQGGTVDVPDRRQVDHVRSTDMVAGQAGRIEFAMQRKIEMLADMKGGAIVLGVVTGNKLGHE